MLLPKINLSVFKREQKPTKEEIRAHILYSSHQTLVFIQPCSFLRRQTNFPTSITFWESRLQRFLLLVHFYTAFFTPILYTCSVVPHTGEIIIVIVLYVPLRCSSKFSYLEPACSN